MGAVEKIAIKKNKKKKKKPAVATALQKAFHTETKFSVSQNRGDSRKKRLHTRVRRKAGEKAFRSLRIHSELIQSTIRCVPSEKKVGVCVVEKKRLYNQKNNQAARVGGGGGDEDDDDDDDDDSGGGGGGDCPSCCPASLRRLPCWRAVNPASAARISLSRPSTALSAQ